MSDRDESTADSATGQPSGSGPPGWLSWAVPAATFVVGLVLGGVVIGVGTGNDSGGPSAAASPSSGGSTSTPTAAVTVTVPNACLQAADTVQQATSLIRSAVTDVRDFSPDKLTRTLNRLEDLDAKARAQADQCSQARVTQGP